MAEAVFLRVGVARPTLHGRIFVLRQRGRTAAADEVPRRVRGKDHEDQTQY